MILRLVVVAVMCMAASCTGDQTCVPRHIELDDRHVVTSSTDQKYQTDDIHYRNCSKVPVPTSRQYIGWYPDPSRLPSEYRIQVNLPQVMAVHSIVFQKTWTQCPDGVHDFSRDGYLQTFDVTYATPGDTSKVFVKYAQNVLALRSNTNENEITFSTPIVTSTLTILPKLYSLYPCFRFKLMGCAPDGMCDANWCMNGAQCTGPNICSCPPGFFGNRCNETLDNLEEQDYTFQSIVNKQLDTPAALFDVIGDGVTIVNDPTRKRDHHHHGHHHSCHFSGHQCHLQYNHHHSHPPSPHGNHHNHPGNHMSTHCMHNLHNNHHGFTTHMNVHLGHNHHGHNGHTYLFSNGGNLFGHNGACLSHHNNHLHFQVSTSTHSWHVSHPCTLQHNQWHSVATSWHPHTGVQISINNTVVASSSQKNPCNACTSTKPLVIGAGHVNVNVNININLNMSINNLLMYNTTLTCLQNLGYSGALTPPPPTTTPAPTTTPLPTTTPIPTTPPPTTATPKPITTTAGTTTAAPTTPTTTSGPLSPQCFNYNQQPSIGASNSTKRCQVGEVCVLYEEQNLYTAKCLDKQLCLSGKRLASGHCWICCESYLCNDHCSASTAKNCKDDPGCATLSSTGFDVCSDSQISVNLCAKTCGVC